ncbi:tetratricopeptide repeat protein [Moheibacter lacus]|uniref:Tetratricopeptide repeat protein n=1 Tax=Moheibacter lacus TaxID=2745851 RepID=A0A838ZL96_9FLAO|nr:tetratricopeptide repeat protein [Moheibacter lacus]MBA5629234.1 tetratricopeptide repeat protein [Moheibacter lacus]
MKNFIYILLPFYLVSCLNKSQPKQNLKSPDYYFALAKKYGSQQQGSEIQQIYYDSVLYVDPNNANTWWEKSTWEIKIGNYIKYFEYMNKAVELDPGAHLGWRGAVKLYYLHDYDGALKDFFDLKKLYPNATSLAARGEDLDFLIGSAYWQKNDFEEAIKYFNKSISENKNGEEWADVYTFVYLGICYNETGEKDSAKIQFEKALKYYKQCVDAYYYLSKIYLEEGNKVVALNHINNAIDYADKGFIKQDSYRDVLGQIYYSDLTDLRNSIRSDK